MFAGCIHPVFARRPAVVAESEGQTAVDRKKASEKANIHVGAQMLIRKQKAAAGP